ncbi:hypothetical protein AB2063_001872 [Clostridium botulinum]
MKKLKKKTKIIMGIIIIILVSLTSGGIFYNKFYKPYYKSMDSIDKEMFNELSNIYNQFNKNKKEIWDVFNFNNEPLILIRTYKEKGVLRKYAYAINIESIENSIFIKKIDMPQYTNIPKVYRISSLYPYLLSSFMPNNFGTVKIKGTEIFYFKYYPEMIKDPKQNQDFSSFLLHEIFHIYKQKHWTYDKNGDGSIIENFPNNKENYALMGVEFSLLDKCLKTNDKNIIKNYLKDWTIIRTYRYNKWPQLKTISKIEAIEGTATYITEKINNLMQGDLRKNYPPKIPYSDEVEYLSNQEKIHLIIFEKSLYYNTGSTLGIILDKLDIDWKKDIEDSKNKKGKTQYEILKKYFNITNEDINTKNIEKIESENNYNSLLKQGEKIVNTVNKNK